MTQPITWFNLNKNSEKYAKYAVKRNITYVFTPEMFYIDTINDYHIIFSPLIYRTYYIPNIYITNTAPLTFNKEYLDELIKANILIPKEISNTLYPIKPDCSKFNPNIRLLLTTACNLNCVYCYADANKSSNYISIEKLQSFLSSVPKNIKGLKIEFHGGEPTVAFKQMKRAHQLITQKFPESTFMIQTNGVFDTKTMDWLINNKITINFSIDGTEEIHNAQRPAINKKTNSYNELVSNVKKAQQHETGIACIVTITKYNLQKMKEIYNFLQTLHFKYIKFNPLLEEGRALLDKQESTTAPDLKVFAIQLADISLEAFQNKIMIDSDLLPNIHTRNPSYARCGAVCNQSTLCPDGEIIACSDAIYLTPDKKDNPFFFASLTETNIEYNQQHKTQLNNSTVDNYPLCQQCFLKWHCAGGCKVENYLANKDIMIPDLKSCEAKKVFLSEYFKKIGEKIL